MESNDPFIAVAIAPRLRRLLRLLVTLAVLLSGIALTRTVAASPVESTRLSLPSGPGSIEGLGRNFTPSLSSGTASYGVDIAVPPAIGGFGPSLALEYDSGGGVSELGLGWRIGGLPSLRRRTEDGLPKFDGSDKFELVGLGATSELLEVAPGVFRPEHESGAFVRVRKSDDGARWEARDKAGVTYRFGGEGCVESEGKQVATYLLCEQLDLHGHRIQYSWEASKGHALLQSVTWNAQTPDSALVVKVSYESRPDVYERFSAGIRQVLDKRVSRIEVTRGGSLVRSYALTYNVAAAGQSSTSGDSRSLLTRVHVTGTDGVTALPDLSFEYTGIRLAAGTGGLTVMSPPPGRSPGEANVSLADLNGDSLPDLLVAQAGQYRSYVNHDGKAWNSGVNWPTSNSPSVSLGDVGVQLSDIDGDGAIDLVAKSGTKEFRWFPAFDATRFGAARSIGTVPSFSFEDPNVRLADMDGDRRTDVVATTSAGLAIGYNLNGKDWTEPTTIGVVDPSQRLMFDDGHTQLCDVNGDRVQDICYLRSESLVYSLGRGRGRFEPARTASGVPQFDPSNPYRLVDLNGDGWVDLVHVGVSQVDYAIASGAGAFTITGSVTGTPTKGATTTIEFADMNGSGTTDIVWVDVSNGPDKAWQYLELFPDGRSGLLKTVDNGLGKVTRITYAPAALGAARSRDEGKPWTTRLNVGMPVVTELRTQSALGDPDIVTRFDYRNGGWDAAERTFAGFGRGIQTDTGDESTPTLVSESTFELGLEARVLRGMPLTSEARDVNGSVFTRSTNTYATRELERVSDGRSVKYAFKSAERVEHIEGQAPGAGKTTLTEWEQDQFGNVIREWRWGLVEGDDKLAGNDEAITLRTYANNESDWILGRLASEELEDAKGKRVALRRSYYDGPAFQGLPLGGVSRGDLRRIESWIDGDYFADEFRAEHDKDGNIITSYDARGGRSEYDYDEARQFLAAERRFVSSERTLEWRAAFDGRFGAVTSIVDPNGHVTTATYDALGRIEKLVRPGDTVNLPTARYEYNFGTPTSIVTTRARAASGSHDELLTLTHVDGFGRPRATFSEGSDPDTWVLNDFALVDARGNVAFKAFPSFSETSEMPALASAFLGARTARDPLGREVGMLLPDGSRTRTAYAPLATTNYDENDLDPLSAARDTPTATMLDGLGRVVSVVEGDGKRELTTGTYAYDPAGKLSKLTDAMGRVRYYLHDGRGRRVQIHDPNAGLWRFDFTDGNDLARRIDPTGRQLSYEYDVLGRVLTEYHSLDGTTESAVAIYHYDTPSAEHPELGNTNGQLAWVEDSAGIEYFGYDNRGRQAESVRRTEDGTEYRNWNDFDAQDRVLRRGFPDRTHLQFSYDSRGLLGAIGGVARDFKWTAHGALASVALENSVTEIRSYDSRLRLERMEATSPDGTVLRGLSYAFDRASRITSVSDLRSSPKPEEDLSASYEYDARNRLTSAIYRNGATAWQLDDLSKITSVKSSFSDPHLNVTNTYGESGTGPDALTHHGAESITYDVAGRVVADGERLYTWDAKGRLAKVTRGEVTEEYFYAHDDQRAVKRTTTNGATETTRYLERDVEVRDGRVIRYVFLGAERLARLDPVDVGPSTAPMTYAEGTTKVGKGGDGDGETKAEFLVRVIHRVNWVALIALLGASAALLLALHLRHSLVGLQWIAASATPLLIAAFIVPAVAACSGDGKRARVAGIRGESTEIATLPEGAEFYLSDHQGSPLVRVDASGLVVSTTAYHPYGHVRHQSGATGDPFSFVGNEADRGTGISDFHARPYRPELGVFLAVDPVALLTAEKQLQQPTHLGAYLYAGANPIGFSDPDGLEPTRMQRFLAKANHVVASIISDGVCMMLGGCGHANAPRVNEKVYNAPTGGEVALNVVAAHVAPRVAGRIVRNIVRSEKAAAKTVATPSAAQKQGGAVVQGGYASVPAKGAPGTYTPNRTLPTDKQGVPIPDVNAPHSQLGRSKPKFGSEPQAREWDYGSNGQLQPKRDIDFTDHGTPDIHPNPHQHQYTPNNPKIAPKGGFQRGSQEPL